MRALLILAVILLAACAMQVPREPTTFSAANAPGKILTIREPINLSAGTGYTSTMPASSRWVQTGTIPQGDVYMIENSVFTVTGMHIHEARVVVRDRMIVGFYLPVERAFSPVSEKVLLPLQ